MDPPNLELVPGMVSKMAQELTASRARIKEMENQAELLQNRVDAAEYALRVMTKNFEEISVENHRLKDSLAELTDSKAKVKEEVVDGTIAGNSPDAKQRAETTSTEPASAEAKDVPALQQALELYYQKYKAQKEAKRQLRDEFDEFKAEIEQEKEEVREAFRISEDRAENAQDKLQQALSDLIVEKEKLEEATKQLDERIEADAARPTILSTQADVEEFMSALPKPIERLAHKQLEPVCLTSLDLKAYIECDTNTQHMGTNFLCLPDRIVWCLSEIVHGIALGPMHLQEQPSSPTWTTNLAFDGVYGKTFHLFYTVGTFVFYAGYYKAIDLRENCPQGISAKQCPEETHEVLSNLTTQSKKLGNTVTRLYTLGALHVEPLGLQCIDFDIEIYKSLRNRFTPVQSITAMLTPGRKRGYFPEDEQQQPSSSKKAKKAGKK